MKIISYKEAGGKVEPLEKAPRRKIKNLTPGHLEEELKGLKYKSELLVMSDVVVSTDDLGMIQEKDRVRGLYKLRGGGFMSHVR